jgi:hypothetical protein
LQGKTNDRPTTSSKYHATHLGIFTDKHLKAKDKLLNKAARLAIGLIPGFPTETIHRPTKEIWLEYAPLKDRATQMRIEHIHDVLNKPTEEDIYHSHMQNE